MVSDDIEHVRVSGGYATPLGSKISHECQHNGKYRQCEVYPQKNYSPLTSKSVNVRTVALDLIHKIQKKLIRVDMTPPITVNMSFVFGDISSSVLPFAGGNVS